MKLTWHKVGLATAGAFGLWLASGGTAFAQEDMVSTAEIAVAMDTFFLLIAAALVFFMQAGFAMLTAGLTRSKNTANILFKNLMDFVMCSIAFWAVGWGLAYGTSAGGFIGTDQFFLGNVTEEGSVPLMGSWLFQVVFAGTAATIVAGAMAERTKFTAYLLYSFILSLFIYPVVVHWVWSGAGWLNAGDGTWGFTDFAGSTVVHSVGGWAALMGAIILGPRLGRFAADGKAKAIPGHNMSLAMLGTFILWLGWFGFNPGSQLAIASQGNADAVALVAVNTNLAAAAGALGALITAWLRYGKPDLGQTINGVLAGLVAITAGCAYVTPAFAVLIGFIGGPLVVFAAEMLEKLKIDDPVGAVPVHLVVGIWGTLAVGLFAAYEGNTGTVGLFYGGGATLLIAQLVGVLAIGIWTAGLAGAMFLAIKATIGLRVSKEEEEAGLDIGEHGAVAYPDLAPGRPFFMPCGEGMRGSQVPARTLTQGVGNPGVPTASTAGCGKPRVSHSFHSRVCGNPWVSHSFHSRAWDPQLPQQGFPQLPQQGVGPTASTAGFPTASTAGCGKPWGSHSFHSRAWETLGFPHGYEIWTKCTKESPSYLLNLSKASARIEYR